MKKGHPDERARGRAAARAREQELEAAMQLLAENPDMRPADLDLVLFPAIGTLAAFKGVLKRRRQKGGGELGAQSRLQSRNDQDLLEWDEEEELVSKCCRAGVFDQSVSSCAFITFKIRELLQRRVLRIYTRVENLYVLDPSHAASLSHCQLITKLASMKQVRGPMFAWVGGR